MPEENPMEWVARVGNADTPAEALAAYLLGAPCLQDYKFVLASPRGATTGFAVNKDFPRGAAVRSLFNTERVVVLDPLTLSDMHSSKEAKYQIDYSISLDTQAVSHLEPYVSGRDPMKIDADLQEVFEFIARDDVSVDPLPYIVENLDNLKSGSASDRIFSKLKAYEVLRTLDLGRLKETGEAHSYLSPVELTKRAQEFIGGMLYDRENAAMMAGLRFAHQFSYVHLLKMVAIRLRWPKASLQQNMERFAEFGDTVLATLGGRETALARAYFERGQDMDFFRKVQKNKPDLLEILRNMAWDLSHVRRMELAMTAQPTSSARYFFSALLTFDKGLIEVLDLYPLKALAFKVGSAEPMPFFAGDWFDLVSDSAEGKVGFQNRYYSRDARASRNLRRLAVRESIDEIVASLENEVASAAEILPRGQYADLLY